MANVKSSTGLKWVAAFLLLFALLANASRLTYLVSDDDVQVSAIEGSAKTLSPELVSHHHALLVSSLFAALILPLVLISMTEVAPAPAPRSGHSSPLSIRPPPTSFRSL